MFHDHKATAEGRETFADLVFRERALRTNFGIYARRHAPALPTLLATGSAQDADRARLVFNDLAQDAAWTQQTTRRIRRIVAHLNRLKVDGPAAEPEGAHWHAARLLELVRQFEAIDRIRARLRPTAVWTLPDRSQSNSAGARRVIDRTARG